LFFEPGDSDALAEKMQWMIAHPEDCSRMGQKARALVEKEYNPTLHYRGLMQVFERFHAKHHEFVN
jgi:glycosyltransferase involved in cell wall biosynthesis